MDQKALADHLRFFSELGVTGINRDPAWRRRLVDPRGVNADQDNTVAAGAPSATEASIGGAADAGGTPGAVPLRLARSSAELLTDIRSDLGDCTRCKLHTLGRRQIVFGVGNPEADVMFVGEAPGADEDIQGEPFVGRAGQLLTKMIQAMGFSRHDVYIANVLKCRPPDNRNPELDEIAECEPFLFRQIASVQPKVVIALGAFAARTLLKTQDPISRLRGRVYSYRGAQLIPTYHPSFLLRSPGNKREAWEDLKKALALLGREPPPQGGGAAESRG